MKKRVSLLMLPLMTAAAFAQDSREQEDPPEVARYSVEIIIFSYDQDISTGSEIFVADEPPPVDMPVDDDLLNGVLDNAMPKVAEPPAQELTADVTARFEFSMMPEADFDLDNIIERLDRLDAYTPLMHFGWTQSTYAEEETDARPLSAFMTPPEGLQGEIKLYLSRYLHLAVNLQLDAPVENTPDNRRGNALRSYPDSPNAAYNERRDDEIAVNYPVRYRIEEDRIFRNGELRYFDHPKFGVLAKITRAETNGAVGDDFESETELLGE